MATAAFLAVGSTKPAGAGPLVIDFESETPRSPSDENYWTPNPGFTIAATVFSSGSYSGFVVSSSTSTGTAGYLFDGNEAEISAQSNGGAGGGVSGSSKFAVAYSDGSYIDLPVGYRPEHVFLANTATAYSAILNGLYQATAFPIPGHSEDWFRVTFTGYSASAGGGSQTGIPIDFYLADYRAGRTLVIDSWTFLDLTPLGEARSIMLSFSSTDTSIFSGVTYSNTPTYVALDNLLLVAVPEPSGFVILAGGAVVAADRLRRRFRGEGADAT